MKKLGFTLVELLGVIVLMALILIIALPLLTDSVRNHEDELNKLEEEVIINSTKLFIDDNSDEYIKKDGAVYCIPLTILKDNEYLKDVKSSDIINKKTVKVSSKKNFVYEVIDNKECKEKFYPSTPNLHNHSLIPVKYINNNWKVVDENSTWYNYENKEWANAVILKNGITKNIGDNVNIDTEVRGIFVWIPRFEYKIESNEIDVNFISTFKKSENYIVPKGFNFDNQELTGIWVGKYETKGNNDNPIVISNSTSITNENIKTYFETSQKFNQYISNGNSHMGKNSEYATILYLTQSKYGTNDEMSTTGNITGIYDINNSNQEYTMSVYNNTVKTSGFTTELENNTKYYDNYTTLDSASIIGEGLNEFNSSSTFVTEDNPWLIKTSLTEYISGDGSSKNDITFRIFIS